MKSSLHDIGAEELRAIDLTQFNGGKSPYPAHDLSLERLFARPIDYYWSTVTETVGATGGRVLDLLCGPGRWSVFLAATNKEVVGVDQLPGCVNIARGLCKHFGLDNAVFHAADVSYIEKLPDEHFDCVWMYSALQYVDRGFALPQVFRVLKPGGRLYVGNYNSTGLMLQHVINGAEKDQINEGSSQWALNALQRGEQHDGYPNYISVKGTPEMCARFGFEVVRAASDADFYKQAAAPSAPGGKKLFGLHDLTVSFVATKRGGASQPPLRAATHPGRFALAARAWRKLRRG